MELKEEKVILNNKHKEITFTTINKYNKVFTKITIMTN